MVAPIVKPEVPYNGDIPGGLQPGRMCRIQGVTHPEADRFNINLQVGPNDKPRDDTALHISVRLNQGYIARNSYKDGEWGEEQGDGDLPIGHAQSWEIIILVDNKDYKVAINGQHFCEFPHRIPSSEVTHLLIDGDVSLTLISWEGITGVGGAERSSSASQLNAEGPQGAQQQFGGPQGYGAPPQGYGAPPQGYGAPPQSYGGYGPPQQGYGPPVPPGAQPESGFDNFLDSAQSMLAGAIKSGAAEKLLGGLLGGGGSQPVQQGYAHQNAKYGIYPDLPQGLEPNRQQTTQNQSNKPGPVESLLTGLLSGGNNQQRGPQGAQQPYQQQGTQQQAHQGIDLGSVLSGLLGGNQQSNVNQSQPGAVPPRNPPPQQNANQQSQGPDIGTFLSGLLSSGNQNSGQVPASQQQNVPGNQQSQGVDFGSLLSGLLSGGNQQPGQAPGSTKTTAPLQQQNVPGGQQSQGVDFGSLLSGLLSGGNQHGQVPPGQVPPGQVPPGQVPPQQQGGSNPNQHSQGLDMGSLLSSLLSSNTQQTQQGQGVPQANAAGNQQPANVDVGALLTGLSGMLSTLQTRPIQETGKGPQPPNQQSQGPDLNQMLAGLFSGGGGNEAPAGGAQGGIQPPQTGGYQQPQTGGSPFAPAQSGGTPWSPAPSGGSPLPPAPSGGSPWPPAPSGGTPLPPAPSGGSPCPPAPSGGTPLPTPPLQTSGGSLPQAIGTPAQGGTAQATQGGGTNASQAASKQVYDDVSDQLAQLIAADGGNSQRQQVGQTHQAQQQYGQYPHPPQQEQKGPLENLLSGFLGGGQQSHQQQPQFGGGESIGGLGSMSGLLQNFAGNILHPKDGNQRQNY